MSAKNAKKHHAMQREQVYLINRNTHISPGKIKPSNLSLNLINLSTQVLNILRQTRHLVEFAPLVRIGNHIADEEFLLLKHN